MQRTDSDTAAREHALTLSVLRVILDVPLRRSFDYLPPETPAQAPILPGMRVRVPFGRQQLVGMVLESAAESDLPPEKLKAVTEVIDTAPIFDQILLQLLCWATQYYHHPIGEVMATALPKSLKLGKSAREEPKKPKKSAKKKRTGDDAVLAGICAEGATPAKLEHTPQDTVAATQGPVLSEEQHAAVAQINAALGRFAVFVLHGITGSGKTEVYLRVVERALRQGKRALVLVPEIGLTPQLVGRFRERFNVALAVLHSALTDKERLLAWREAYSGQARIVLGTRSAVFAPVSDLGVIIIDEEHDPSFKQHEGGFRYCARDVAVVRAQKAQVPIVLGSATPALETLHNTLAREGRADKASAARYVRLCLPRRTAQAAPPRMALIDLRAHSVKGGLSTPAVQAIERHLQSDGQVLVFLNRRGYAPTLLCTTCGWVAPCQDCDARLTVHQSAQRLRCHHCGADAPLPSHCPTCGFAVKPVGQGTERIAETLSGLFPDVTLVRLDRDVVRRRGDMEATMQRMASGEARILVGTQMVTKGHDFPNVTLVVVLNADQGLFSTDFRAPERLAQTIVQVAGRAGRGSKPGEVLIQTEYPEHPLLQNLLLEGYEGFARTALEDRKQAAWPPFSRLVTVRDSAPTAQAALAFLSDARARAKTLPAASTFSRHVRLLGPVPAAMAKRAGRYHAQLLIESVDRGALHRFLDAWVPEIEQLPSARKVRWALDVDPFELF